jgi:basic membrane protein A
MILIMGLAACKQDHPCAAENVFCVGLVTTTVGLQDHGINQDAWTGLETLKAEGQIDQINHIESVDARDYSKNISYFAENEYDVIVTSGAGLEDETLRAAEEYPGLVFIAIEQHPEQDLANLVPVTFAEDRIGYLAGALAAHLSRTKIVGAVCETSGIDSMWRYCEGFRAGTKATADELDIEIQVLVEYRDQGSQENLFIDEEWGMERSQYLMKRGADVIFAAGGATGQAALRAASEAGIHSIGTERDQAAALGEEGSSVVTSIYGSAGNEVQQMVREIRAGNLDPTIPGQFGYVPLGLAFPESLTTYMNELLVQLVNGDVQTNVTLEKP